ncbi:hypothetical protein LPB140_08515 [Sphingorhabdus lutea]|uniref:HPr kinase/phosphorylase C-terminal domain-containing protein n=1 Tax=Sphingorhabdus lutea TaxID=1913578 RepID=A0A1L3JCF8_9SPHN|nr:hypothetical protein [Sphingorhabdus lutea]APG62825.1 hypothetical protein LPB140_08515 [Sphingorhabdus lutea]
MAQQLKIIHASSVAIDGQAVIIMGPSGSGKTQSCLDLIDRGAMLIADDQCVLSKNNGHIHISSISGFEGKIELRNVGIIQMEHCQNIPAALCVALNPNAPRFPSKYHSFDFDGLQIVKMEMAHTPNIAQKIELSLQQINLGNIVIGANAIGG